MRTVVHYFSLLMIIPYTKLIKASRTVEEMAIWCFGATALLLVLKLTAFYLDEREIRNGTVFFVKNKVNPFLKIVFWTFLVWVVYKSINDMNNLEMHTPGRISRKIIEFFGYGFSREPVLENIYYHLNFLFLLAVYLFDFKWYNSISFKKKNNKLKIHDRITLVNELNLPVNDQLEVVGDKIILHNKGKGKKEYD
ncbi:MAG: hypothetical protein AAFZ15_03240 [Bacteroidota bacterium]